MRFHLRLRVLAALPSALLICTTIVGAQAYECRWDKIAGPGGEWTTGWRPGMPTPYCGSETQPGQIQKCDCGGQQNYCGQFPSGAEIVHWPNGCGAPPWILRCTYK
jgi:hypothetical protein